MSKSRTMIRGSRRLPTQHVTIRVPWHDAGWDGTVCKDPANNTSCLILKRIAEKRDDALECMHAGKRFVDLPTAEVPPCVDEHATVLSPDSLIRTKRHPYTDNNPDTHGHMKDTPLELAGYAAAAVPFRWMLKSEVEGKAEALAIGYQFVREPRARSQARIAGSRAPIRISLLTGPMGSGTGTGTKAGLGVELVFAGLLGEHGNQTHAT